MADAISPEFWAWLEERQKKLAAIPLPKLKAAMLALRQHQEETCTMPKQPRDSEQEAQLSHRSLIQTARDASPEADHPEVRR